MSEVVRVGVVAEGPTDHTIIEQILVEHFGPTDIEYTAIHPELSVAFTPVDSDLGFGWGGVFRWCGQVRQEGSGSLSGSYAMTAFDLLVVHLDCDVAQAKYSDLGVLHVPDNLPCALPCPPAVHTIERLEAVLLGWLGEVQPPERLALCIPAQATEGWILAALYPNDPDSHAQRTNCLARPDVRLSTKPVAGRLVSGGRKRVDAYRERAPEVAARWRAISETCASALRFKLRLQAILPQ